MVSDFVIGVFSTVVGTVIDWMPTITLPSWMTSTSGGIATVFGYAGSMGAWFPLSLTVTVVVAILAAYLVAFAIKLVRIVASFATMGGGSAA